jgi:hypothetical protein
MPNEDAKKAVVVLGSSPAGLKELDDIPLRDADAPFISNDVAPITIESMARYLRELTNAPKGARGNAYPIEQSPTIFSTHDEKGNTSELRTPSSSAQKVFASDTDKDVIVSIASQVFDEDTLRKLVDPQTRTHEIFKKFIPTSPGRNPESEVPPDAPDVQKKISSVLLRNRFSPNPGILPRVSPPFLGLGTPSSNIDNFSIGKGQSNLGAYDSTATDTITYEQMKKIGLALMLRATGELIGADGDPTTFGNEIAALVPGSAQLLGSRILDKKSMWAADLTVDQGRPIGLGLQDKSLSLDLVLDDGAKSYGALNSPLEPFGGFAPAGMLLLAAALVLAIKLLSEGFELILKIPGDPTSSPAPSPDGLIRVPGSSRNETLSTSESVVALFGFTPTKHAYAEAFDRGVDVFFGMGNRSATAFNDFVNGADRLLESAGYYVVMLREIIRSSGRIVTEIVMHLSQVPSAPSKGF